jgi:2',3'-cyclic-nucleotide 2'-phosphodiesterase (5'-nucleotidase family)
LAGCSNPQRNFTYEWRVLPVDSRYDNGKNLKAAEIISKYQPQVAPLMEIIGYSTDDYASYVPESPLSNFAADVIFKRGEKEFGKRVDMSLTNFGGIRSELPKGDIRIYDIFAIFPFENTIVVAQMPGKELKELIGKMVSRGRVEAMSGVELIIDNKRLVKCLVAGKPIDESRVYNVATINFLVSGGDGIRIKDRGDNLFDTGVLIRDAVVDEIRSITASGDNITLKKDGRVIYKNREM